MNQIDAPQLWIQLDHSPASQYGVGPRAMLRPTKLVRAQQPVLARLLGLEERDSGGGSLVWFGLGMITINVLFC